VYIDAFKVRCQHGIDLVEQEDIEISNRIKESVSRSGYEGQILGWFMKDTNTPPYFYTFRYVDSLIQRAMEEYSWAETNRVRATAWMCATCGNHWTSSKIGDGYRDFMKIAQPEVLWAYLYPIDSETEYTGYTGDGLQADINKQIVTLCDSIRAVMA